MGGPARKLRGGNESVCLHKVLHGWCPVGKRECVSSQSVAWMVSSGETRVCVLTKCCVDGV